ncbi:MAG: hypothetical protein GY839_18175 [candidate division Zixibacteria bacterium]|nr:hypothetical protein [candidate division Zixibacteria bacterium]
MSKKITIVALVFALVMIIASPGLLYAGSKIPQTAINSILDHKTGLELTDSQFKKLSIINNVIIEKMIQTRAQAEIRKMEIDEFTSNWTNMHSTASDHIIKEYYKFLAELKSLELEAITKARAVLTREQLRAYANLSSVEAMIIKLDSIELAADY